MKTVLTLTVLTLSFAFALGTGFPAAAATGQSNARALPERTMGSPAAPVSVIEFASLTCPHCAEFHTKVLPEIERSYIETNKVRFAYRDFPLDGLALKAAQLAQCMPEDRYFAFIKTLYANQPAWTKAEKPEEALERFAKLAGLSATQITACKDDKSVLEALVRQRMEADEKYKISGTPTLVFNDKDATTEVHDFGEFEERVKKYLR